MTTDIRLTPTRIAGTAFVAESPSADRIRRSAPPIMALAVAILDWMERVKKFREEEDTYLANGRYEQALDDHRSAVASLFGEGEILRFQWKKQSEKLPELGFTIADLEATTSGLLSTFVCEHSPRIDDAMRQEISALFPEQ